MARGTRDTLQLQIGLSPLQRVSEFIYYTHPKAIQLGHMEAAKIFLARGETPGSNSFGINDLMVCLQMDDKTKTLEAIEMLSKYGK